MINPGEGEISQNFSINAEDYRIEDHIEAAEKGNIEEQFELAMCYINGKQKDYAIAVKWLEKVLEARKKAYGKKSIYAAEANYFIAECYKNLKEYEKAVSYYRDTLSVYEKEYEADHYMVTDILSDIEKCSKLMKKQNKHK